MVVVTDDQLGIAEKRGAAVLRDGPRALSARYEATAHRVTIDLANGCGVSLPVDSIQELHGANAEALSDIVVDGLGLNLNWPALDVDLYVPALVQGILGSKDWMTREAARIAGQATSPAKAIAARSNGAKGGRPRKTAKI